ncbi:MAG: cysteine hydrolase [Clostridia bacterium]|nr:cysteine hydrolase [Clostridia bacterium]
MKLPDKKNFLENCSKALSEIYDTLNELKELDIKDCESKKTVLVIVDVINGFVREGALKSERIESIIPEIACLSKACDALGIEKLAFCDYHTQESPEFDAYPPHCLAGTFEAEIVDEIKNIGGYKLIPKNSTNGFLEEAFQEWLEQNIDKDTFIITGDCTDICIQQFAITLKTWFNMKNRKSRVIVPMNMVETYDFGVHNGDLVNTMALYNMMINGVEVVKKCRPA